MGARIETAVILGTSLGRGTPVGTPPGAWLHSCQICGTLFDRFDVSVEMKTLFTVGALLLCLTSASSVDGQAVCRDGWQSMSSGRGTCSWHGGVDYWGYKNAPTSRLYLEPDYSQLLGREAEGINTLRQGHESRDLSVERQGAFERFVGLYTYALTVSNMVDEATEDRISGLPEITVSPSSSTDWVEKAYEDLLVAHSSQTIEQVMLDLWFPETDYPCGAFMDSEAVALFMDTGYQDRVLKSSAYCFENADKY
jgi:hypothetical protein